MTHEKIFEDAIHSERFVQVRRRIFRQLIESLQYEGILDVVPGQDGAFSSQAGGVTYSWRARRRAGFDRVRLDETPVMRTVDGVTSEAESLTLFLLDLRERHRAPENLLARFVNELDQTLMKDTLSPRKDLAGASYDEMESLGDGHPYHPAYKSRVGFDYLDDAAFGPESEPLLHPLWLGARHDCTFFTASNSIDVAEFLKAQGAPARDGYLAIPVHPWQWREHLAPLLFHDLREGRLVVLGRTADAYRPQQSIRTLSNASRPEGATMKLSLSIVNTSTSRILASHTVQNGPIISDWLHGIAASDPFLSDLVILREVLGTAYQAPRLAPEHDARYGVLSCIWRESLQPFIRTGESAMPFTALCHGRLIAPWIASCGLERWVRRLLEVAVPPVLHFLCAHGIALESHAQNMILLHDNGWPTRLALRDFHDGVRFAPGGLADPAGMPRLHATPASHVGVNRNSFVVTDDVRKVRDFVLDAFFFVNMSELALVLEERHGLDERRFWTMVSDVIESWEHAHPELRDRFEQFDLRAEHIEVEKLTNRRMFPESEVQVHAVPNPLAAVLAR